MKKAKLTIFLLLLILTVVFVISSAQAQTKVYEWTLLSGDQEGQMATVFSEKYAKLVEEKSDGRIKIKVHPYGAFGSNINILELVQMGEVEFCSIDTSWVANLVPEISVFNLQYIWPKNKLEEVSNYVTKSGKSIELLGEAFRNQNFQLLGVFPLSWFYISSKKPIHSPADCKGLKHRVWGNPILISAYNVFGFNSQSMPWTEIYGGLQLGTLDSQYQTLTSNYNRSYHEVTDYMTCIFNEIPVMCPLMNKIAFDNLPNDLKQVVIDSCLEVTKSESTYIKWLIEMEEAAKEKMLKEKPSITIYELTDEEILPFKEIAKNDVTTLEYYYDIAGELGKKIYSQLLEDIDNAIKIFTN